MLDSSLVMTWLDLLYPYLMVPLVMKFNYAIMMVIILRDLVTECATDDLQISGNPVSVFHSSGFLFGRTVMTPPPHLPYGAVLAWVK